MATPAQIRAAGYVIEAENRHRWTAAAAVRSCRRRNGSYSGPVTVLRTGARFYALPSFFRPPIDALLAAGWAEVVL